MKIKNIHNAFTIVETSNHKIVCDPWIAEGLFDGTWGKFPCVDNIEKYLDKEEIMKYLHFDYYVYDHIKKSPFLWEWQHGKIF